MTGADKNGMATTLSSPRKTRKRCAVYCRVSTDERLDQEFNSIDAQREAGAAYIASQRAEGWIPVADDYDDPAFSGGNMDRPALKRLMADIGAGQIDIVVVYKIDRLTRSLSDFSRMVEVFERQGVSFVAVTQQINSATPMGRLMLNVLLSFAQFEREVTGERIRDKIAASKKKGLWMGGIPPLGYDVKNRQLVINPDEAATVRRIFQMMLDCRAPSRIVRQLNEEGVMTKSWITQTGKQHQGVPMHRQHIYALLRNRIYLGELSLKGSWFPGSHPAVIELALWEQVHAILRQAPQARRADTGRARSEALLRGLLFTAEGEAFYPTYTNRQGRKFHYYVTRSNSVGHGKSSVHQRVPAKTLETATVAQIQRVLASPETIAAVCQNLAEQDSPIEEAEAVLALHRLGQVWEQLFPTEQQRLVQLMIERIELHDQGLHIRWRPVGWRELLGEFTPESIGPELIEMEAVA
jgi:DNA invertase Pin-like site-specific DNA recombinase